MTVLLDAEDARISVDDVIALSELSLATRGSRLLVAGDTDALVAALAGAPLVRAGEPAADDDVMARGVAHVSGGVLRVHGADVESGAHHQVTGIALRDMPLAPSWTVNEYLSWAARLSGAPLARAHETLERLRLESLAQKRLRALSRLERRAIGLAQALVCDPPALVLEAPLADLDKSEASAVTALIARASEGRGVIIAAAELGPGDPHGELARSADDLVLLRGGRLVVHADPAHAFAGARLYELTVAREADAFREALALRGIELSGGPRHFAARLPADLATTELLSAAAAARAPLLACLPVLDAVEWRGAPETRSP